MLDKTLETLEYNRIISLLSDFCQTASGKTLADSLQPTVEINYLRDMHDETASAKKVIQFLGDPKLMGVYDLSEHLHLAKIGSVLAIKDFLEIKSTIQVYHYLKRYIAISSEYELDENRIIDAIENLYEFKSLESNLDRCIISEDELADNASRELFSIRKKKSRKTQEIQSTLEKIIRSNENTNILQDNIITLRDGRYVVPVRSANKSSFPGIIHDQSASGSTYFIEPMSVVNLNNDLRSLENEEFREIKRILAELTNQVQAGYEEFIANQKIIMHLDFNFAKARLGLKMNATSPVLTESRIVNLKNARHPLLQGKVVPIDVHFGDDFNTLIITGPNTGGKTVVLKTIGLFILMAQSGLQIPSDEGSIIGIFDNIYSDIGDKQSIEQSLSTFSASMSNIVQILDQATSKSLVLFDEIGAGTDPVEGAALAVAILDQLLKNDIRTVATTHYSQLKLYAISTDNVMNASVEFNVDTLSPTYRLIIGTPGKSNAFEISKKLGLSPQIIEDAELQISTDSKQFEDVLTKIEQNRIHSETLKAELLSKTNEINRLKNKLELELESAQHERQSIINAAKSEAKKIVVEAKNISTETIRSLKEYHPDKISDIDKTNFIIQSDLKTQLDKYETSIQTTKKKRKSINPQKIKLGDEVHVLSMNDVGQVLSLPDKNGNLQVQIGIMKFTVNIESLDFSNTSGGKTNTASKINNIIKAKAQTHVEQDIDLRGSTAEDAIYLLDKFLDDAYITGLKNVSIIHGKGTGVLRKEIGEYLRKHKLIKSFRLGNENEGGSGVTVAKLN